MNRRSFLGALAALPIVGRLVPQAAVAAPAPKVLTMTICSEYTAIADIVELHYALDCGRNHKPAITPSIKDAEWA